MRGAAAGDAIWSLELRSDYHAEAGRMRMEAGQRAEEMRVLASVSWFRGLSAAAVATLYSRGRRVAVPGYGTFIR